jgi:hypothetical protein
MVPGITQDYSSASPLLPFSIRAASGSVTSSRGRNPEDGFRYYLTGFTNGTYARMALDNATPLSYGSEPMWKQSVEVEERRGSFGIWDGVVKYGPVKLPDAGDWIWGFDCAVETAHITWARQHIADYLSSSAPSGATVPNHKGAIGVNQSGDVEGVDIYVPKFEWWEKHEIAYQSAAQAWALSLTLANAGGCTNASVFRGFGPNTVLFLGGSGERSNTRPSLFEINVRFRGGQDATAGNGNPLTIGNISNIDKGAWQYVWVEPRPDLSTPTAGMVHSPYAAHVEEVYPSIDFSLLGLNPGPPMY